MPLWINETKISEAYWQAYKRTQDFLEGAWRFDADLIYRRFRDGSFFSPEMLHFSRGETPGSSEQQAKRDTEDAIVTAEYGVRPKDEYWVEAKSEKPEDRNLRCVSCTKSGSPRMITRSCLKNGCFENSLRRKSRRRARRCAAVESTPFATASVTPTSRSEIELPEAKSHDASGLVHVAHPMPASVENYISTTPSSQSHILGPSSRRHSIEKSTRSKFHTKLTGATSISPSVEAHTGFESHETEHGSWRDM
jgi:hypothetical protein